MRKQKESSRATLLAVMRSYEGYYRNDGDTIALFKLAWRWNLLCAEYGDTPASLAKLFPETVAYVFKTMGDWYADSTREWPKVKRTRLGKAFKIEGIQRANPWRGHAESLHRENARLDLMALPRSERSAARVPIAERHGLVPEHPHSAVAAERMARRKLKV
jgi:hypothetical protein